MSDPHNYYADSQGYSIPTYDVKPKDKPKPKPAPKPKPKPPGYSQADDEETPIADAITDLAVGAVLGSIFD